MATMKMKRLNLINFYLPLHEYTKPTHIHKKKRRKKLKKIKIYIKKLVNSNYYNDMKYEKRTNENVLYMHACMHDIVY